MDKLQLVFYGTGGRDGLAVVFLGEFREPSRRGVNTCVIIAVTTRFRRYSSIHTAFVGRFGDGLWADLLVSSKLVAEYITCHVSSMCCSRESGLSSLFLLSPAVLWHAYLTSNSDR